MDGNRIEHGTLKKDFLEASACQIDDQFLCGKEFVGCGGQIYIRIPISGENFA